MLDASSLRSKLQRTLQMDLSFASTEKPGVRHFDHDKAKVLQEARAFSDSPVNVKLCSNIITKVLFLLAGGEPLTSEETSSLFFGLTRLFQSQDDRLRRMVYMLLKELPVSPREAFVVTSCLAKDATSSNDLHRANALRALSRLADPAMATQIERYLKTAIVDKNPFVASSAILCAIKLLRIAPDVVRRWSSEIQGCVNTRYPMVQMHALVLLHALKGSDRMAQRKSIAELTRSRSKGVVAECVLIHYVVETLQHDADPRLHEELLNYLESCLRNRNERVTFEAARAMCDLVVAAHRTNFQGYAGLATYDVGSALAVMQAFVSSPTPVMRFGAVRVFNRLGQENMQAVGRYSAYLEPLLTEPNRSIATLALTTLLNTGHESNVERLIKHISSFMGEISDAFKLDIVRAVLHLCLAYPSKHKTLMTFLASNLREEGGLELKSETVNALICIVKRVPAAHELGLMQLCEFIEDCEYPVLCTRVLSLLGDEAPSWTSPSKFIRFIYNRLILEKAVVRAAGVDSLFKIAGKCPNLRKDILALLAGCQIDVDDEVRDRTNLYCAALQQALSVHGEIPRGGDAACNLEDLLGSASPSVDSLCEAVQLHLADESLLQITFDPSNLPVEPEHSQLPHAENTSFGDVGDVSRRNEQRPGLMTSEGGQIVSDVLSATAGRARVEDELKNFVGCIITPEELGYFHLSSKATCLTEKEAEYTVEVIRHVFSAAIVLQFRISNTVEGQVLERVAMKLTTVEGPWEVMGSIPIDSLVYGAMQSTYSVIRRIQSSETVESSLVSASMTYIVKEDGDDIGYEDEYPVEPVAITVANFTVPKLLRSGEFKSLWESLEAGSSEAVTKLSLSFRALDAAVEGIVNALNMAACDRTDVLDPGLANHTLHLCGMFLGGSQVLCKAMLLMSKEHGCLLKLVVRSSDAAVCRAVSQAFE